VFNNEEVKWWQSTMGRKLDVVTMMKNMAEVMKTPICKLTFSQKKIMNMSPTCTMLGVPRVFT